VEIHIRYSGPLIQLTGKRQESIALTGHATLREVIHHLAEAYGPEFRRLFPNDGHQSEAMFVILRNGHVHEDYDEVLKDRDEIALVARFAGGSQTNTRAKHGLLDLQPPTSTQGRIHSAAREVKLG
jgi:MoaD family protein